MKKLFTILGLLACFWAHAQSDLVITEIMYNPPESGSDSTEFIEIQNIGMMPINMAGYSFTQGVVYTFPSVTVPAGGYIVVCVDSVAMQTVFGVTAWQWTSGGLSNSGEDIILVDASSNPMDTVDFDDSAPWPTSPDGSGPSLVLCDPTSDNNMGSNWTASGSNTGTTVNGFMLMASPGAADAACGPITPSIPTYPIADINNTDVDGVADSVGVSCWTQGVVLGVNMRPAGLQFTIWDNEGIGVFNNSGNLGYTVNEGDSVMIRGTVAQFNGLTQINPDSIVLVNSSNMIPTPTVVTSLGENTESELVRFENALITDVNGSNYELVSGNDTITMRVDSDTDVDDSLSFATGDSLCYVIGIGGQFDSSNPFTSGYQLFPRYFMDVDTTCGGTPTPPPAPVIFTYDIGVVNTVDANGEPDSNGVVCAVEGIVYGQNVRGSGLQFTLIDATGGINVFSFTNGTGYTVNEGDEVRVIGEIDFFNGLTEIVPDSIRILSTGNCVPFATVVTTLDESTESQYVELLNVTVIDASQWPMAGGGSANVDVLLSNGDTAVLRFDSDALLGDSLAAPTGAFSVAGIGGQFDNSMPFTSGYQLFPMWTRDVRTIPMTVPTDLVINELMADNDAVISDNNGEFDSWIEIYNGSGTDVDLVGYYMSNDPAGSPFRIQRCFNNAPAMVTVPANGFGLLWADDDIDQGANLLGFELNANGGFTGLHAMDGVTPIDSISFGAQQTDVSFGRRSDGVNDWVQFETSTPNESNNSGVVLSVINQVADENPFRAYPNPVQNGVVFFNKPVNATLFNSLGQAVIQVENANQLNLDGAMTNGIYFLKTESGDIVRLVIQ